MPFHTQTSATAPTSRLGGGGLDFITKTSFSAVASVSFDQVFTSSYTSYRIIVIGTGSVANLLKLRLRVSGVDDSGANYLYGQLYSSFNAASGTNGSGVSAVDYWSPGFMGSGLSGQIAFDIGEPATTTYTTLSSLSTRSDGGAVGYTGFNGGVHNQATSYDGFTAFPISGTITAAVTIYGYRKA